jgi:hypothetical protein
MKPLPKVATEMALNILAYDMKRVMAILDGEQARRNGETQQSCSLTVDHELELAWLLHRQFGSLLTFDDVPDVIADDALRELGHGTRPDQGGNSRPLEPPPVALPR